jgi:hypothetical protein
MTTGASFAALPLKSLLGFGDLSTRFLQYLKQSHIDATKARWDIDGVFASKLSLASAGASKFSIAGTSRSTDGQGHLLDVTQIGLGNSLYATSLFENANAVTYYVGLKYCEVPGGVRTNPRSGVPEYIAYREEIGVSAAPNAVALVSGNLVFTVDSVTEAAVSNAGRFVMVYKNVPGDLAVNDTIALPDPIAVTWTGSNNKVTAPNLGQSTPSLVAADYTVVLIGPAVKRNTNLTTAPGYVFLSTVIGAGSTNPPGAFDNSAQQLLVTFEDADVVRAELEAFEASLLSNALPGSTLVGVAPSAYTARKPIVNTGTLLPVASVGLGNQADATLPANARVSDVLLAIDKQLSRTRGWSGTAANGADSVAEISNGALGDASRSGGAFFLKQASTFLVDGAFQSVASPYFLGETEAADLESTNARARPVLTFDRGASRNSIQPGHYERLRVASASTTKPLSLNGTGIVPGGKFIDCEIVGGQLDIDGAAVTSGLKPFHLLDTIIDSKISGFTHLLTGAMTMGVGGADLPAHGIVENCVFVGPTSAVLTPTPVATLNITSGLGTSSGLAAVVDDDPLATGNQDRPIVFKNCCFYDQCEIPLVRISTKQKIVFENCHFYGKTGGTAGSTLFVADAGANIVLRDCMMFAPAGVFFSGDRIVGSIENLWMVCGTSTTAAHAQAFIACGTQQEALKLTNINLLVDRGCVRPVSDAPPTPPLAMVQLGKFASNRGLMQVNGFSIVYKAGLPVHAAETLLVVGTDGASSFDNLSVDFASCRPDGTNTNNADVTWSAVAAGLVTIVSEGGTFGPFARPKCRNVSVRGLSNPLSTSGNVNTTVVALAGADVDGLEVQVNYSVGDAQYHSHVHVLNNTALRGYSDYNVANCSSALFFMTGNFNHVSDVRIGAQLGGPTAPSLAIFYASGNNNRVDNVELVAQPGSWFNQIKLFGSNNIFSHFMVQFATSTGAPLTLGSSTGEHHNTLQASSFSYDATSLNCVALMAAKTLVTGNIFQRVSGSTVAILDTGSSNVVSNNIDSV